MQPDKTKEESKQYGGVTHKHDKNAGSGAFQQGTEQDPDYEGGVADGTPDPANVSKEKENPKAKPDDESINNS
jgi:hypothetical protein